MVYHSHIMLRSLTEWCVCVWVWVCVCVRGSVGIHVCECMLHEAISLLLMWSAMLFSTESHSTADSSHVIRCLHTDDFSLETFTSETWSRRGNTSSSPFCFQDIKTAKELWSVLGDSVLSLTINKNNVGDNSISNLGNHLWFLFPLMRSNVLLPQCHGLQHDANSCGKHDWILTLTSTISTFFRDMEEKRETI